MDTLCRQENKTGLTRVRFQKSNNLLAFFLLLELNHLHFWMVILVRSVLYPYSDLLRQSETLFSKILNKSTTLFFFTLNVRNGTSVLILGAIFTFFLHVTMET